MDLISPTGYRPYDPDPQTPTGIQAVTRDQAGSVYQSLTSVVARRLAGQAPARQRRHVVCFDLYHSPDIDVFLGQFRAAWETAYGPATWIDTRRAFGAALELSYAETVIIPGACGPYRLEPLGDAELKVVKSYVRP